jgi:hypothetical protein
VAAALKVFLKTTITHFYQPFETWQLRQAGRAATTLTSSVSEAEIWTGVPARHIRGIFSTRTKE